MTKFAGAGGKRHAARTRALEAPLGRSLAISGYGNRWEPSWTAQRPRRVPAARVQYSDTALLCQIGTSLDGKFEAAGIRTSVKIAGGNSFKQSPCRNIANLRPNWVLA